MSNNNNNKNQKSVYQFATSNATGDFKATYVTYSPRRKQRKTLYIEKGHTRIALTGNQINSLKRLFLKEKQINKKTS